MSDALVKRLRDGCSCDFPDNPCMAEEDCRDAFAAADRIEELEKQSKKICEALLKVMRSHNEIQAKLEKAMRYMSEHSNDQHLVGWAKHNLAELTGGKDE